jgi:phosphoribosylaminoimidazole carboxylase (NCAIR synthetase)
MVAKSPRSVASYPVVETVQRNNICHLVLAPARVPADVYKAAMDLASAAISSLDGYGIFGVELFQMPDGKILLNEIAPRPHNSGHYTMEGCTTDQFEQHLRAILDLPLGCTDLAVGGSSSSTSGRGGGGCALMVNVLGADDGTEESTMAPMKKALEVR